MSKESRRRQRADGQPAGARPAPTELVGASTPDRQSASRPSTRPASTERAGRRARARPGPRGSFIERYRRLLLGAAVVVVVAVVGAGVFAAATQPAFACSTVWEPSPSAAPSAGASPQAGFVQPDMGNAHVPNGTVIRYTNCPPASGRHFNQSGSGPISARLYGPNDSVVPQGWVHNLEHGGLVVLYRGVEVDETALRSLFDAVPASPVCGFPPGGQSPGPVIARFDQMAWPFAALVWDRVLPLQTLDQAAILDFYARYGELTNPEKLCASPSPSGAPSPSAPGAPSPSASGAASPSASSSASPSTAPSVSPS